MFNVFSIYHNTSSNRFKKKTYPYCSVSTIFHVSPSVGLCPSGMDTGPLLLIGDGSEIWQTHQLRLVVEVPLFTTGFKNIQTVVVFAGFLNISSDWISEGQIPNVDKFISLRSGDFVGMYPNPNVGPLWGNPYKPYTTWVFMGDNPQESLENMYRIIPDLYHLSKDRWLATQLTCVLVCHSPWPQITTKLVSGATRHRS